MVTLLAMMYLAKRNKSIIIVYLKECSGYADFQPIDDNRVTQIIEGFLFKVKCMFEQRWSIQRQTNSIISGFKMSSSSLYIMRLSFKWLGTSCCSAHPREIFMRLGPSPGYVVGSHDRFVAPHYVASETAFVPLPWPFHQDICAVSASLDDDSKSMSTLEEKI
jgi:hypothetical protein